jgi:lipoprotein-releasing system permease protein
MAYESFIGVRYLMAKKRSDVLSIITLISVAGIAIGVTAMIVVLSVMGGFEGDLKGKILGTRTHIVVSGADDRRIPDSLDLADAIEAVPGVVGASPFLEAEVMISSPTNLSGVVLRGISPDRVGRVSDLDRNLVDGDLKYLARPERVRPGRRGLSDPEELDRILDELEAEHDIPNPDAATQGRHLPGVEGRVFDRPDGAPVIDQGASEDFRRRFLQSPAKLATPDPDGPAANPNAPDPYGDDAPDGFMPALPGQATASADPYGDDAPAGFMPPLPGGERPQEDAPAPLPVARREVPGIVIGRELKKSLQVDIGSEVNVVAPRGDIGPSGPIPRSRPFKVVGVFYSGMYEYDTKYVYIDLDSAREFMNYAPGELTGVEIKTDDVERVTEIRDGVRARLDQLPQRDSVQVRDWKEMNRSLFVALEMEKVAMFLVLVFIILVASFSIASNLIMIVIEKAREVAILKSMGASNGGVMRIFVVQGALIGALGTTIGLILGVLCCLIIEFWGIELDADVYYISHLPVAMNLTEIALIAVSSLALSTGMTLFPAVQAVLLQPVEGLRYD